MIRRIACFFVATLLVSLSSAVLASDDAYMRLARLSYLEGNVSVQGSIDVDWSAASINFPFEPGDRIYTGLDGRAEIEFDDGSVFRLAEETDLEILSLSEHLIQLRIMVGLTALTVSSGLEFEINTPAAAFNTLRRGSYRFEVDHNGETSAIVRKGRLEAANNKFVQLVGSGERLRIFLGGNTDLVRYAGRDSWDEWNDRRNADMQAHASRKHLPGSVYIGISDLDRYGRWMHVESYGMAWVPFSVSVSWSPYSVGRWCYRPYFGWTWISYQPWGWLPFHYGRWYHSVSIGWCWLPGPSFSFNFWSPGLVAFYRGPGWVSWCPLGPGDYYNITHYHYNKVVHHYQVSRMRAIHKRAPGNAFHHKNAGAFQTVSTDHFRNGSMRSDGIATRRGYVKQPSSRGSYVEDDLGFKPTAASYKGAPDRTGIQPARTNSLPAVVRTNPKVPAEGRGEYRQITNPQVSSARSRGNLNRNENTLSVRQSRSDPAVREIRFRATNQDNQSVGNQAENKLTPQSGRRMTASRQSTSDTTSEDIQRNERTVPAAGAQSNSRSNSRNAPSSRYENSPQQQNRTVQPRSTAQPRTESRRQLSSPTRSTSAVERINRTQSRTQTLPDTGKDRNLSVPRQSSSSAARNSNDLSTRTQSSGTVSGRIIAPSTRSSGSSNVRSMGSASRSSGSLSGQSTASPSRSSGIFSGRSSTPSAGSSGGFSGRSSSPSTRSSGGVSSGRSSGGAQMRSNGGSSGAARRNR